MLPKKKKKNYLLVVEGSIPTAEKGKYATVGEEKERTLTLLEELAKTALKIIALGSCSSFGGIPKAQPNPAECKSVKEILAEKNITTPLINIPGATSS
ncbi:MAG: hypothetical protein DRP80_04230 [Candidatus Omnitrophota bacterium]|nr:MAG: hypothetical protein DRP80_04230 [Candidatus Omnitrophota bacterium]